MQCHAAPADANARPSEPELSRFGQVCGDAGARPGCPNSTPDGLAAVRLVAGRGTDPPGECTVSVRPLLRPGAVTMKLGHLRQAPAVSISCWVVQLHCVFPRLQFCWENEVHVGPTQPLKRSIGPMHFAGSEHVVNPPARSLFLQRNVAMAQE